MRIVEILGGIQLPISNEEYDILAQFDPQNSLVPKSSLNEREQILANQLVNKGVLIRRNQDGKIYYKKQDSYQR